MRPSEIKARAEKKFGKLQKEKFKYLYINGGKTSRQLAKEFKIRNQTADNFAKTLLNDGMPPRLFKSVNRKLDTDKVLKILRRRFNDNISTKVIASEFNVSISTIQYIVAGRSWKFAFEKFKKEKDEKPEEKQKEDSSSSSC